MAKTAPKNQLRLKLNLLHPNEIPPSLPTRFLRWIVSYGRYIVIFTEIIVVSAFIYRFKLDYDLDNIKTSINKDLPFIEGMIADEALINQTQSKFQTIGTVYANTPSWKRIFDNLSSEIPPSVRINSLNLESNDAQNEFLNIKLIGRTTSINDLGLFIKKLRTLQDAQGTKLFKDIALDSLNYDKQEILFSLSGGTKRK
jgi:hypothetical protein